jgi:transposase
MNIYDYYISLDWSQAKMAIAISQKSSDESRVVELDSKGKGKQSHTLETEFDRFNLATADSYIAQYEDAKKIYQERFKQFIGKSKTLRALHSIPGIGVIGAVRIAAVVVDPARFRDKGRFWSYCGLAKHHKMSGGRSYGKRTPRYSRALKCVFKTAALAVIESGSRNSLRDYYDSLLSRGVAPWNARNKVANKIADLALSIMGSGKLYQAGRLEKC